MNTQAFDAADFDQRIAAMMRWHFDPATGSPFWLSRRDRLGFDPISDIRSARDLLRFPDLSDELRTVPVTDLVPQALSKNLFRVYESGGTTGAPKRIVDHGYRARMLVWAKSVLVASGVPESANWLHLGPTGPHVFAYDCGQYAALGDGMIYTVDFDPRWVKRLIAAGRGDVVSDYVRHLLDQARHILASQPVTVLSTTPPLVEAICADEELFDLVSSKIKAIIWAGTSFSPESLRQVRENLFPEASVVGIYGNTLMGVAPQRPAHPQDSHGCVFEPYAESTLLELVDEHGRQVDYGQRGQVRLHVISEEMLLPNVVERDTAIRVRPSHPAGIDGLADVQTIKSVDDVSVIEGVY